MDTLDVIEPVQATTSLRTYQPALLKVPGKKQNPATPRRQKEEKWSSDLNPQDLRCLLTILEDALIPQLVRSYSPARSAPLRPIEPSDA